MQAGPNSMPYKNSRRSFLLLLIFSGLSQLSLAQFMDQEAARVGATTAVIVLGTQVQSTALDCSHFVNSLFEQVGLSYQYEPSRVLYRGSAAFVRVYRPLAGDLIVWPGHVGIIVDPIQRTFISALRRGVRTSAYSSSYWRRRGRARFFRYRLPMSRDSQPMSQSELTSDEQASQHLAMH